MDELLCYIQQEESSQELSFEEKLENQKTLLLKQRQVDDFKKIVAETKKCRQQLKEDDRRTIRNATKTRDLFHKIDELKMSVQSIIDRNIGHTMNEIRQLSLRMYLKDEELEKKRQRIKDLQELLEKHQAISNHVRESKGQIMQREAQAQSAMEKRKLDKVRSEIESIWSVHRMKQEDEWKQTKIMSVEISKLWIDIKTREEEKEAIVQNTELMRTKVGQLYEDIEQQRVQDEEDAKRFETELDERVLTPMKIVHADIDQNAFKNPNDFPTLVDKIQCTRRTYEHIFKRPEYMDLRKCKRNGKRTKPRVAVEILAKPLKDYFKVTQSQPTIQNTAVPEKPKQSASSQSPKRIQVESAKKETKQHGKIVEPPPSKLEKSTSAGQQKPVSIVAAQQSKKRSKTFKSQPEPVIAPDTALNKDAAPRAKRDNSEGHIPTREKQKPVQSISSEQSRKRTKLTKSQPETVILPIDEPDPQSTKKDLHTTTHISTALPPTKSQKSKKSEVQPNSCKGSSILSNDIPPKLSQQRKSNSKAIQFDQEPVKAPTRSQTPPTPSPPPPSPPQDEEQFSEPMSVEEQALSDADSGPGADISPQAVPRRKDNDDGNLFDTVSLNSSVSSLDLEDRDRNSDLGFDLSPIGSITGKGRSGGSNGGDLDFDFLPNSPKQSKRSQRDKGSFDFMDEDNSGGGDDFDFF